MSFLCFCLKRNTNLSVCLARGPKAGTPSEYQVLLIQIDVIERIPLYISLLLCPVSILSVLIMQKTLVVWGWTGFNTAPDRPARCAFTHWFGVDSNTGI